MSELITGANAVADTSLEEQLKSRDVIIADLRRQLAQSYHDGTSAEIELSRKSASGKIQTVKATVYWNQTKVAAFVTSALGNILAAYHYIATHIITRGH